MLLSHPRTHEKTNKQGRDSKKNMVSQVLFVDLALLSRGTPTLSVSLPKKILRTADCIPFLRIYKLLVG